MTHRDTQEHRPLVVHGHRARVIVALVGFLISLGVPVVVLGAPGLTADEQTVGPPDDPAGFGITGDPLPGDAGPGTESPGTESPSAGVSGDSTGAVPPWIPTPPSLPNGPLGIPGVVLGAYQRAERTLMASRPGCHLSWSVLAGIGRIESDHASGGRVDATGNTLGPILGPRLDGSAGMAAIPDTDHGVLDGDPVWDRAVGPMQFIPSSWRSWGVGSPDNIYDSTLAAGRYLCAGSADLSDPAQLQAAVLRYNHSETYADVVLRWAHAYLTGVIPTPPAPGPVPPGTNGNGGRPITANTTPPPAAAAAAIAQPTPLTSTPPATTPPATTPNSPPPPATTTTPPATTPNPPPAPSTGTTTTSPATTPPSTESTPTPSPPPVTVTTPPATTSSPPTAGP